MSSATPPPYLKGWYLRERQENVALRRSKRSTWKTASLLYAAFMVALCAAIVMSMFKQTRPQSKLGPSADEIMLKSAPSGADDFEKWERVQSDRLRKEFKK